MELTLDRKVSDNRIFPALNIQQSGTRKEELLLAPDALACNRVIRLVDGLRDRNLVAHCQGYRKKKGGGFQSKLKALPSFFSLMSPLFTVDQTEADPNAPLVIVKDEKGQPCKPSDIGVYNAACLKVGHLREWMRSFQIDTPVQPGRKELTRMFSSADMSKHGRLYGWWQNMKPEQRLRIQLDGEPVTELDYSQMHPSLLYHKLGMAVPSNAYIDVQDTPMRELAKATFGRMLNSKDEKGTRHAFAKELGSPKKADAIIDQLLAIHHPLEREGNFWSGAGLELMHRDSEVAVLMMTWARFKNLPLLPVHDSFLVATKHAEAVEKQMKATYHAYMGIEPNIKRCSA